MKLEVFDLNFSRKGIINLFSLVQYSVKFAGVGSFSITCPLDNAELLQKNRIVWFDGTVAGIIQYIHGLSGDSKELTVKGNIITDFLAWRTLATTYQKSGLANEIMVDLVEKNLVLPENSARKIPHLSIGDTGSSSTKIVYQTTGSTVQEALTDIAEPHSLGYEIGFYPKEKAFKFNVLNSVDHSLGNTEGNTQVIFSRALDNILSGEYEYSELDYKSVASVAGAGTGSYRSLLYHYDGDVEPEGFSRKEIYVDARDLQTTVTNEDGIETEYTEEEYTELLAQRGAETLSESCKIDSYSGTVRSDSLTNFTYGTDYQLGDIVTVYDTDLGVTINAQVTEIDFYYDSSGLEITPVFGTGQPTLVDRLKKKGVL